MAEREQRCHRQPRRRPGGARRRVVPLALVAVVLAAMLAAGARAQSSAPGGPGQALPRFVSLKSDRVNMRSGPGLETPILWVYRRAGLPVEVLRESGDGWRQVRDAEGATGWVLQIMLSNRRTALVLPWEAKPGAAPPRIAVRAEQSSRAAAVAEIEAGVIANVTACDRAWCHVVVGDIRGYVEKKTLWGVYPDEEIR